MDAPVIFYLSLGGTFTSSDNLVHYLILPLSLTLLIFKQKSTVIRTNSLNLRILENEGWFSCFDKFRVAKLILHLCGGSGSILRCIQKNATLQTDQQMKV